MMLTTVSLLLPLALTTTADPAAPPSFHDLQAHVTGFNTVPCGTARGSSAPCTRKI